MKKYLSLLKKRSFKGPASIWKRLLAFVVDILIIDLIVSFPFRRLITDILPVDEENIAQVYQILVNNPELKNIMLMISISMGLIALLYFAVFEYYTNQTLGKMLLNISVESENKKLLLWQCFARNLFIIPFFPFFLLWVIDPLWLLYTGGKKRLSDVFAKTMVVESHSF